VATAKLKINYKTQKTQTNSQVKNYEMRHELKSDQTTGTIQKFRMHVFKLHLLWRKL